VIKDIFFGEEINDIDISIKMKLTDEEIESFTTSDSCANPNKTLVPHGACGSPRRGVDSKKLFN
jgi:hypothetical protein